MTYIDSRTCAEKFEQELNHFQYMKNCESTSTENKNKLVGMISNLISEFYVDTTQLSNFMYEYPDKSRIFIYSYKDNWVVQACH